MGSVEIKVWLESYQGLKFEYDTWYERWVMLDAEQYIPAIREGDGSKRNPGASDRMANATMRRIEFEERTADEINGIKRAMEAIETAINAMTDPMQRGVLKQRYIVGDGKYGMKPWGRIAMMLYHRDDETGLKRVWRLHNSALSSLEEIVNENGNVLL